MIVQFIQTKLLTKVGKFDSNKSNINWYKKNGFLVEYAEILERTDFLGDSYSFSSRIYCILNGIFIAPMCPQCNDNLVKFKNSTDGFFLTCSSKCSANSKERWIKYKATNLDKYGVEFSTQASIVREKFENTLLVNYGVTTTFASKEIQNKISNTNTERYGCAIGFGSKIIQDKILVTNQERYGSNVPNSNPEVLKFLSDEIWLTEEFSTKNSKTIAFELNCSKTFVNYWARIHKIENRANIYSEENEISEFIEVLGITDIKKNVYGIIGNVSGLGRRQLDIYLPEKNIAIELNGVYWHSDNKTRHIEKLNLCRDSEIKLLQFWDYQWNEKTDICKSIIKSNLGLNGRIFARKCSIIEITSKEYCTFLYENHLQGPVKSSIRYGLICDGKLVSAIGFSKSRYDKSYDWELIRYVNICGINVVGGFSRLLKHFRNHNIGSIISYCDLMVFDGRMYKESGFTNIRDTVPGFFYSKGTAIASRESMQKHKLIGILKNFDESLTAEQNLSNAGWKKVWNCGNGVWELI